VAVWETIPLLQNNSDRIQMNFRDVKVIKMKFYHAGIIFLRINDRFWHYMRIVFNINKRL